MSERDKPKSWLSPSVGAMLEQSWDSLVARGLMAFREREQKALALGSQDSCYRLARAVFERQVCNIRKKGWTEEEREALFSAFKSLGRMAEEKYGKAYFPLAWFYNSGWRILPAGRESSASDDFAVLSDHGLSVRYEQSAFEWCLQNRHLEDPELWFDLAACYLRGISVEPDYEQSLHWLKKSAEQGHELAQSQLGRMYETGRGSERNDAQAAYWYRRAADQGNAWAQAELGAMHLKGKGVEQDFSQAALRFRKAAERGNVAAQCFLAWLYRDGRGVEQNHEKSAFWFRKAAEQGDELAQYFLGGLCEELAGQGLPDMGCEQAADWYRKAAEQGHADSQKQLGKLYRDGCGVARDDGQAFLWFRRAAEQGNDWAQYYLGMMYREGRGVLRDDVQALYWLYKAAEQGLAQAQDEVGRIAGGEIEMPAAEADVAGLQAELFSAPSGRRRFAMRKRCMRVTRGSGRTRKPNRRSRRLRAKGKVHAARRD